MKLWKISQERNSGYDTYDSAVVVAASAAEARRIYPGGGEPSEWALRTTWASVNDVQAVEIGHALPSLEAGTVVVASFNAG